MNLLLINSTITVLKSFFAFGIISNLASMNNKVIRLWISFLIALPSYVIAKPLFVDVSQHVSYSKLLTPRENLVIKFFNFKPDFEYNCNIVGNASAVHNEFTFPLPDISQRSYIPSHRLSFYIQTKNAEPSALNLLAYQIVVRNNTKKEERINIICRPTLIISFPSSTQSTHSSTSTSSSLVQVDIDVYNHQLKLANFNKLMDTVEPKLKAQPNTPAMDRYIFKRAALIMYEIATQEPDHAQRNQEAWLGFHGQAAWTHWLKTHISNQESTVLILIENVLATGIQLDVALNYFASLLSTIHTSKFNSKQESRLISNQRNQRNGVQTNYNPVTDRTVALSLHRLLQHYGPINDTESFQLLEQILRFYIAENADIESPKDAFYFAEKNPCFNIYTVAYRCFRNMKLASWNWSDTDTGLIDYPHMIGLMLKALTDEDEIQRCLVSRGLSVSPTRITEVKMENLEAFFRVMAEVTREYNFVSEGESEDVLLGSSPDLSMCPHGTYNSLVACGNGKHSKILVLHNARDKLTQFIQSAAKDQLKSMPEQTRKSILIIRNEELINGVTLFDIVHMAKTAGPKQEHAILYLQFLRKLSALAFEEFHMNDEEKRLLNASNIEDELRELHWRDLFDE